MSVIDLVEELLRRGVHLEPDGERLKVEAPEGVLSEEMRASIVEHKAEIIDMRKRSAEIRLRIRNALGEVEQKYAGRIDWEKDTPDVKACEMLLDAAMAAYVDGVCTLDDVQKKFKQYVRSLFVQYEVHDLRQPALFE